MLTDGKAAFAARYDAAHGLVAVRRADGKLDAYRPNAALVRTLSR